MNNFVKVFLGIIGSSAVIAFIILAINAIAIPSCWIDWRNSKMEWQVSMGTCQVNHPQMGWIPATKIRGSE